MPRSVRKSSQRLILRHTLEEKLRKPAATEQLVFYRQSSYCRNILELAANKLLYPVRPVTNVQGLPSLTAGHVRSKDKGIFNTGMERRTVPVSDLSMKPVSICCKSRHRCSYNLTPLIPPPYGRCSKYGLSNTCTPVIGGECPPAALNKFNNCDRLTDECTMV